ncbi:MAG: hypothetical protein OEZ36_08250 [Spirochaetota bacterium]|nr:hypothetical protein [Spirochaetota bacterium]
MLIDLNTEERTIRLGDVVFAIYDDASGELTVRDFLHVGIAMINYPNIENRDSDIFVYDMLPNEPDRRTWGSQHSYQVDLVGRMVNNNRELSDISRKKIIDVAEKVVRDTYKLMDMTNGKNCCQWEIKKYKTDIYDLSTTKISFSCAGLAEYCYEQAGSDIIDDDPMCDDEHSEEDFCDKNSLPIVHFGKSYVHRLYPAYQIKAFKDDNYPLNLKKLSEKEDITVYQNYPFI